MNRNYCKYCKAPLNWATYREDWKGPTVCLNCLASKKTLVVAKEEEEDYR